MSARETPPADTGGDPHGDIRHRVARLLRPDRYSLAGLAIFILVAISEWREYTRLHEVIYLLGPRRVLDPSFLALDLTWGGALSPTSWLFDHLVAPPLAWFGEFGVANLGRALTWALSAWAFTLLTRTLRLPWWSMAVGFGAWLFYGQTQTTCGLPFEGFQVKSLSYPLSWLSLVFAIRGQAVRAGCAAGIATAFHVVVGGWACASLFASLAVNRKLFTNRELVRFLLATSPFIVPLVLALGLWHFGGGPGADTGRQDEIYVTFAMPHCLDPNSFLKGPKPFYLLPVFILAPLLVRAWPHERGSRVLSVYLMATMALFLAGLVAWEAEAYGFLKLYPFQLAASIPLLFFFTFSMAHIKVAPAAGKGLRVAWLAALVAGICLIDVRDVSEEAASAPIKFVQRVHRLANDGIQRKGNDRLHAWIRETSPTDSVFITPMTEEFWAYAERAQVVQFNHPPLDERLLAWRERLGELNRGQPFRFRAFNNRRDFDRNVNRLSVAELVNIRDRYGATHYLASVDRPELRRHLVFTADKWHVYRIDKLLP